LQKSIAMVVWTAAATLETVI